MRIADVMFAIFVLVESKNRSVVMFVKEIKLKNGETRKELELEKRN